MLARKILQQKAAFKGGSSFMALQRCSLQPPIIAPNNFSNSTMQAKLVSQPLLPSHRCFASSQKGGKNKRGQTGQNKNKTGGKGGKKDEDNPFANMSLEELKQNDLGESLEKLLEGTEFDRKLEEYLDEMERQGISEDQLLKDMLGGQKNLDTLNNDKGIKFDVSNKNLQENAMHSDLMNAFSKVMKDNGKQQELNKLKDIFTEMEEADEEDGVYSFTETDAFTAAFNEQVETGKKFLVIFAATIVNEETNESWCPDCTKANPYIQRIVHSNSSGRIILQGLVTPEAWCGNAAHPFRLAPYGAQGVPTMSLYEGTSLLHKVDDMSKFRDIGHMDIFLQL